MADVINAGTNLPYVYTTDDLDGNPRIIDGIVDMGAYEYIPEPFLFINCYLLIVTYYLLFLPRVYRCINPIDK